MKKIIIWEVLPSLLQFILVVNWMIINPPERRKPNIKLNMNGGHNL